MKKAGAIVLTLLLVIGFVAMPVFAQTEAAGSRPRRLPPGIVIAAGFSMGMCGRALRDRPGNAWAQRLAKQLASEPGSGWGGIRTAMILGLVFIETLVLFTLVMVVIKVTY